MSSKSAAAIKASHAQKRNAINQNKRKNKVPPIASIDKTLPDSDDVQKHYVYRDFSNVVDEGDTGEIYQEGLLQALTYSTALAAAQVLKQQQYYLTPPPIVRASCFVRSQRFPVKLYALLNERNLSQVISWMPHGRSWKVLKPRIFETAVLPVFFESNDYHSFNRVVNAWSFRRKSTGPDRGSYFHELFLRGKPHLQEHMRRLPRTHKKIAMEKKDEPDFYELEKVSPLPTLMDSAELERLQSQRRVAGTLKKSTRDMS